MRYLELTVAYIEQASSVPSIWDNLVNLTNGSGTKFQLVFEGLTVTDWGIRLVPAFRPITIFTSAGLFYLGSVKIVGYFRDDIPLKEGDVLALVGAAGGIAAGLAIITPLGAVATAAIGAVNISVAFANIVGWDSMNYTYSYIRNLMRHAFLPLPSSSMAKTYIAPDGSFATRSEIVLNHGNRVQVLAPGWNGGVYAPSSANFADAYPYISGFSDPIGDGSDYTGGGPIDYPPWHFEYGFPEPCPDYCDRFIIDPNGLGYTCIGTRC